MFCQQSLCTLAVLIMSAGVALVTGWDAHDLQNAGVAQRTFTSFGLVLQKS